ncbi:MAG: cellulase family glycosylhydrolase, partial [Bacteroidota bacterium]|nr:cellulase family glycosylhydrolase [Bacteroidota bacterium]
NPANCIEKIHNDMERIYNMGFNTVRVCGFTVKQSEDCENIASEYTDSLQSPYTTHFDLIEQFTDIASEHNLKVILLTAGHKVDGVKLKYGSYLEELAQRFKYNSAIFAYDIYNEPSVDRHHTSSTPDNKNYVFDMFSNWYDNIRNNTANQLVTVGTFPGDAISRWDPAVMKVDFMSFHTYPTSRVQTEGYDYTYGTQRVAREMKWLSYVYDKLWIIGETGFSATDNPAHNQYSYIKTEQEQEEYVDVTLERNKNCGGKGYSWWQYQDVKYYAWDKPDSKVNCYGLIHRDTDTSDTEWGITKDVVDSMDGTAPFFQFEPFNIDPNGCPYPVHPNNDDVYYDPYNFKPNYEVSGIVYDPYGNPLANAIVHGWKSIGDSLNPKYITYTDDNGEFILYTNPSVPPPVVGLSVSYPGLSKHYEWSGNVQDNQAIYLEDTIQVPTPGFSDICITGTDIQWTDTVSLPGNLTIESNASLTIKSCLFLKENKKITVKSEALLIIDEGSLKGNCNTPWQGIEVKDGGNLEIKNNGAIEMFDYLKINEGATLVYYEGSSINLYNSESYVEITGDLYIENNATFTFTGDGYIKFSNPGGDATNNIFCGTNSSFVLQGSGQNDKIMEVQQSTVKIKWCSPANIAC